ncbi:MAG: GNAT family N-acetyltransferase [Thermoanaerobaculia bacterium]
MGRIKIGNLKKEDLRNLKILLKNLNTFSQEEVKVAMEMAEEFLEKGKKSDYNFFVARNDEKLLGFVCFGPTPLTKHTYDLYWIAVSKEYQRKNLGKLLLEFSEGKIKKEGGKLIIIETSSTSKYAKARKFYKKYGFKKITEIKNFYKNKDNKIVYVKYLKGGK